MFHVPPKWHLGDWEVAHVTIWDRPSDSHDLDVLVAEHCDHIIGRRLMRTASIF
jgi:hypothetical protein